jgi:ubiquinone/menaquinone biosynthesis C-methylase UbiE
LRKRKLSKDYKYGYVLEEPSQAFLKDLLDRAKTTKLFENKKVLDVGCGFGTGSLIISQKAKEVIGLDITEYEEWKLFKSKKLKFIKGSSSKLPFKDNIFDGVHLKDLLHHIKDVDKTLEEIKRVTKPNGIIIIYEANRYNPLFYLYITKLCGHDHFTQAEFKKLLNDKFPDNRFIHSEAYPPFRLPMPLFKHILSIEKKINKLSFLRPIFTYNIAVVKNIKKPDSKRS